MTPRWLALALAGCHEEPRLPDAEPVTEDCLAEPIEVALGTGPYGDEPLADGSPVVLVHGLYGGWYIFTAGRVEHSEPEVVIRGEVTAPDLGVVVSKSQALNLGLFYDPTSCSGAFYGLRTRIDFERADGPSGHDFVCSLEGQRLDFAITVTDQVSGREGTSEVEVVAELDPMDVCP